MAKSHTSKRDARRDQRAAKKQKEMSVGTPIAAGAIAPIQPPPPPIVAPPADAPHNTEGYDHIQENEFIAVADKPLSTFSIDVDTASYSNVRRFLNSGQLPPADAVRVEEMINYFSYTYSEPRGRTPFSVNTEVADCPWNPDHRLVHVGVKGKTVTVVPPRNLVFLIDVSGSMESADKLPMLKRAMRKLVRQLGPRDRVSIVVYAGASGVVLNPTSGANNLKINAALARLKAGGSTNGGQGIQLAYDLARKTFKKGGINRVILATDGDFNVGISSRGELERLIERERESGVYLTVLGFGTGNVKDSQMEMLADKGNGNYAYIDSDRESQKVLVDELGATLVTIAKDVKIQVEFNPAEVESYRLVGYENRALADRDFNDDTKDAGEIGSGHTVTALYEVVPRGQGARPGVDPLRYQEGRDLSAAADSGELMHLKLRYKQPDGDRSTLVTFPVRDHDRALAQTSDNFRFSASVASFGMLLRDSKYSGETSFREVHDMASGALGRDAHGHRGEFITLVKQAARLKGESLSGGLAIAR
ncbi:MAG: VWA domain-containing protein [Myxococcales bacterium]|nr:VWA domain-containing protein [Myxococcales bacterium]